MPQRCIGRGTFARASTASPMRGCRRAGFVCALRAPGAASGAPTMRAPPIPTPIRVEAIPMKSHPLRTMPYMRRPRTRPGRRWVCGGLAPARGDIGYAVPLLCRGGTRAARRGARGRAMPEGLSRLVHNAQFGAFLAEMCTRLRVVDEADRSRHLVTWGFRRYSRRQGSIFRPQRAIRCFSGREMHEIARCGRGGLSRSRSSAAQPACSVQRREFNNRYLAFRVNSGSGTTMGS